MKKSIFVVLLTVIGIVACRKECGPKSEVCRETPPTDELCAAYFATWFYNAEKNSCEQIGYSGCSAKGFVTLEECETCKCR